MSRLNWKFKLIFFLLPLFLYMGECNFNCRTTTGPTPPDDDPPVLIEGKYERVYPVVTSNPNMAVDIWSDEKGGMTTKLIETSENKFSFRDYLWKANYPNGKIYEICISDMPIYTPERVSAGKIITLNGKVLQSIVLRQTENGPKEKALFRIDKNGVVYDAYEQF